MPSANAGEMVTGLTAGSEVSTHEVLHQAAVSFAAEFARLGYSVVRLMELFADPFYAPAYVALRLLGEPAVRHIVAEAVRGRGALPRSAGVTVVTPRAAPSRRRPPP